MKALSLNPLQRELEQKAIKAIKHENIYALDSFPVPVCSDIRISQSKMYQNELYIEDTLQLGKAISLELKFTYFLPKMENLSSLLLNQDLSVILKLLKNLALTYLANL